MRSSATIRNRLLSLKVRFHLSINQFDMFAKYFFFSQKFDLIQIDLLINLIADNSSSSDHIPTFFIYSFNICSRGLSIHKIDSIKHPATQNRTFVKTHKFNGDIVFLSFPFPNFIRSIALFRFLCAFFLLKNLWISGV